MDVVLSSFPMEQSGILDFSTHGLGDYGTFSFWPMLIGGFFLYVSYYGCDQTQIQRELSSKSVDDSKLSLFLNGIFRFPLVATYCLLGMALAVFILKHPEFRLLLQAQPTAAPNYNVAVPIFCLHYLPHGVIGVVMASLFAAGMSSLDSTINSLSATTMRDVVHRFILKGSLDQKQQLCWSRCATAFWGVLCVVFSFCVADISASIIEAVNKISSLVNGPILGTFLLAVLTLRASDRGVILGVVSGFLTNVVLWKCAPGVSWLWWNAVGCVVTFGVGYIASLLLQGRKPAEKVRALTVYRTERIASSRRWWIYYIVLSIYAVCILAFLKLLETALLARH